MNDELFFQNLVDRIEAGSTDDRRAPSSVKSRLYSALVAAQAADGPLRSLPATRAAGQPLCVFESVLSVVPNEQVASMNACRVCHARLLAERFESPPIYWPHCPYVKFQRD